MLENYFAAKKKLYPQRVKGKIRRLKWLLNCLFLSIYGILPFLQFNRGENVPNQAILIDIVGSKFYFFFIEIWPQEVYYLAGILIIAAVALFFVTSLFGRIWCGYACFQTVWTDIFIAVELLFQGDRNDRILLDRKNNFKKIWRKTTTHLCWILISLATGLIFTCYFNDSHELIADLFRNKISTKILCWICGIAGATYLMAGFAREHVCTFMCPYSRFQSAMFDDNTLIISYDHKRGEPRAKMTADKNFVNRGHCIECKQCVVVCPVGIDIRNGLQMECIACGLCIDACDAVMEKIGLPKGLIRYDTLNHLLDPQPKKRFKVMRMRSFYYGIILSLVCFGMLRSLIMKPKFEAEIAPERNPAYVKLSDGSIRNDYVLKIFNKTYKAVEFELQLATDKNTDSNKPSQQLVLQGANRNQESQKILVEANSMRQFKIYLIANQKIIDNLKDDISVAELVLKNVSEGSKIRLQTVFISK